MSLKDISYLELSQPLCSVERNHLCNFGRRHPEEQFCEIILKFGPVVQEEMFKEKVYGRRTKTDHNTSPRAFGSGELKMQFL